MKKLTPSPASRSIAGPIINDALYSMTKNVLDIPGIHPDRPYYVIWVSHRLGGVLILTFTTYGKLSPVSQHNTRRDYPPLAGEYRAMLFNYYDGIGLTQGIMWPYPWKYSTYSFGRLRKAVSTKQRIPTAVKETIIWYVTHGEDFLPQALADVIQGTPTERPPLRYL